MTTSKRIRNYFSNLPEGEELYTRDNLDAIEKTQSLLDKDLVSQLQQFLILDLRSRLTVEGRKILDKFVAETEAEEDLQLRLITGLNRIIEKGLVLMQFLAHYDLEDLTYTRGLTKQWITPEIHAEYLKDNPGLISILGKAEDRRKLTELFKDSAEGAFPKPFYGIKPTEQYVDFIDQPSSKGHDD